MAQTMPLTIGADARCTDGSCGRVSRLIVKPVAREVTHVVVDPEHGHGPGRLVPVDLVDATTGQIQIRCTMAEFQALQPSKETEAVPDRMNQAQSRGRLVLPTPPRAVTVDRVPPGEVDVRCGLTVCATDGEIGQVQGVVVETGGHNVTHVLLQEGHPWGRKEVAIPIGVVTKIGTMLIHLTINKHQVERLPPRTH
jgi:sporulation protein YlmC with PRC-barrel domain